MTITATIAGTGSDTTLDLRAPRFAVDQIHNAGTDLIAVTPTGETIVVTPSSFNSIQIRRFNPSNGINTAFGNLGVVTQTFASTSYPYPRTVELDAQGRILIGGSGGQTSGTSNGNFLMRLNADGSPDSTFGVGGRLIGFGNPGDRPNDIDIRPTGEIIVTLQVNGTSRFKLLQLGDTGRADAFGYRDLGVNGAANESVLLADGSIISTGFGWVAKVTPAGQLDPSFGTGGVVTLDGGGRSVENDGLAIDSAGRIVVASNPFDVVNGTVMPEIGLTRLLPNGSVDVTFGDGGRVITPLPAESASAANLELDLNDRIYVGGQATRRDNPFARTAVLLRYTADGVLDTTFDGDGIARNPMGLAQNGDMVRSIAVDGDNLMFFSGRFTDAGLGRLFANDAAADYGDAVTVAVAAGLPSFVITSSAGLAINSGSSTQLTFRRPADRAADALTINLQTTRLMGLPNYVNVPATATFAAGQTETTVTAEVFGIPPTVAQLPFTVTATADGYAASSLTMQALSFVAPTFTASIGVTGGQPTIAEGQQIGGQITLSRPSNRPQTFTVTTDDSQVILTQSTLTIPAGANRVEFGVIGRQDGVVDFTQAIDLVFTPTNDDFGTAPQTVRVTVTDADVQGFAFGRNLQNRNLTEGVPVQFEVTVTKPYDRPVTFELFLPPGSVDEFGGDIAITPLTLAAGQLTGSIGVLAVNDGVQEPTESLPLSLRSVNSGPADRFFGTATWQILDVNAEPFALNPVGESAVEGGRTQTVEIDLGRTFPFDLPVNLFVLTTQTEPDNDPDFQIPQSVVVPAGSRTVTFDVTAIDDDRVDGTQLGRIGAVASLPDGQPELRTTVDVQTLDDEIAEVSLILDVGQGPFPLPEGQPLVVAEGQDTFAVVRHNLHPSHPLYATGFDVLLTSDNEAFPLPATFTVDPSAFGGQGFDFIAAYPIDQDNVVGADRPFNFTIAAEGFVGGSLSGVIEDDDVAVFDFGTVDQLGEGETGGFGFGTSGGSNPGVVFAEDIVLTLTSSDPSRIELLTTQIILPAGQSAVGIADAFRAIDDDVFTGDAVVTITGQIPGYPDLVREIRVIENDPAPQPPVILTLDGPTLEAPGRVGQAVSLLTVFGDDDRDNHTATIDWGDGTIVTLSSGQINQLTDTFTANHVYAAGGRYQVTVTVDDGNAADTQAVVLAIAGYNIAGGVLTFVGTPGDDRLDVRSHQGGMRIMTQLDGERTVRDDVPLDSVTSVEAYLGGGDDRLRIERDVLVDVIADGGAGNDDIDTADGDDRIIDMLGDNRINTRGGNDFVRTGGGADRINVGDGNDLVIAGGGDDRINGGAGRDVLIGGTGADRIAGGRGEDLLISTSLGTDRSEAQIRTIAALWAGSGDYAERIDALLAGGDDFDPIDPNANRDDAIDTLLGGGDQDWLLGNLNDELRNGRRDRTDRN